MSRANLESAAAGDYPDSPAARTRWILARRGSKNPLDPFRPYAFLREEEIGPSGDQVPTATLFLTNRECPYRCLMCDLWQNTLDERVPAGAIPSQIEHALAALTPVRQVKLYNAGSFFDPSAIPPEDHLAIAHLCRPMERVIVECHPSFVGGRTLAFRAMLAGRLEVAMGLETVHGPTLERLNKRLTLQSFGAAAAFLRDHHIDLRVFILLRPPFMDEVEGLEWAMRSIDFAFDCGATACTVIPTRAGNGAIEELAATGEYAPPSLRSLEEAVEYGIRLGQGRVFADLWDIERFHTCACSPARTARLAAINCNQQNPPPIDCPHCS